MNKLTSTFAGLALAAGVSVAPAFAQGNLFSPPGSFTFSVPAAATFTASGIGETFNPTTGSPVLNEGFLLIGSQVPGSTFLYNVTTFQVIGPTSFSEPGPLQFTVFSLPAGGVSIASVGAAADGTTFNLVGGSPVPEASTTASFGLLLMLGLGGLLVAAKRKKTASAL